MQLSPVPSVEQVKELEVVDVTLASTESRSNCSVLTYEAPQKESLRKNKLHVL